jgi:hypothetical protein
LACNKPRIRFVIRKLQANVFLHQRRVGELHAVVQRLKSIDQPIPVIRGLHGQDFNPFLKRLQRTANRRQVVWQSPLEYDLPRFIQKRTKHVVTVQIQTTVQYTRCVHVFSLFSCGTTFIPLRGA